MNTQRKNEFLQMIAIVTLLSFVTTQSSMAAPVSNAGIHPSATSNSWIDTANENEMGEMSLPESIGKLKTVFRGSKDKLFIHIQDAHVNEEAQQHIAEILKYFVDHHGLKLINVEGAEGRLYPEFLQAFPDASVRSSVADLLMREGRMSGAEYLAVTDRPDVFLNGIEDEELYLQNRKAYLDALEFKTRDQALLEELGKVLKNLTRFAFSPALSELYQKRSQFKDGQEDLVSYVKYLVEIAAQHALTLDQFPDLKAFTELMQLEKEINFNRADHDLDRFVRALKQNMPRDRLPKFLESTVQLRMKKIKKSEFFRVLKTEFESMSSDANSPNFSAVSQLKAQHQNAIKFVDYMFRYDQVGVSLFSDMDQVESLVQEKLFTKDAERGFARIMKLFEIYQRLFAFELTKNDADYFYAHKSDFKISDLRKALDPYLKQYHFSDGVPSQLDLLDTDLPKVEKFYELAIARDQILIQKSMEAASASDAKVVAIVTGGFHTPGIERRLRAEGYSYMVLTPAMTRSWDAERENQIYAEALQKKPLALEAMATESVVVSPSTEKTDVQFQLSPGLILPSEKTLPAFLQLVSGMGRAEERGILRNHGAVILALMLMWFQTVVQHQSVDAAQAAVQSELLRRSDWRSDIREAILQGVILNPAAYRVENNAPTFYFSTSAGIFALSQLPAGRSVSISIPGIRQTRAEMRLNLQSRKVNLSIFGSRVSQDDLPAWASSLLATPRKGASVVIRPSGIQTTDKAVSTNHRPRVEKPAQKPQLHVAVPLAPVVIQPAALQESKQEIAKPKSSSQAASPSVLVKKEKAMPSQVPVPKEVRSEVPTVETQQPVINDSLGNQMRHEIETRGLWLVQKVSPFYYRSKLLTLWVIRIYSQDATREHRYQPTAFVALSGGDLRAQLQGPRVTWTDVTQSVKRLLTGTQKKGRRVIELAGPGLFGHPLFVLVVGRNQDYVLMGKQAINQARHLNIHQMVFQRFSDISEFIDLRILNWWAQLQTRFKGETFVAVRKADLNRKPLPDNSAQVAAGIAAADALRKEGVVAAALEILSQPNSNTHGLGMERRIQDSLSTVIQGSRLGEFPIHAVTEPGILIYEWKTDLSYLGQIEFIKALLFDHRSAKSKTTLIISLQPSLEDVEYWKSAIEESLADWEHFSVQMESVAEIVTAEKERLQLSDVFQIRGTDRLLQEVKSRKGRDGLKGVGYSLAAFAPGRILHIGDSQLPRGSHDLPVEFMDVYDLMTKVAAQVAIESAA